MRAAEVQPGDVVHWMDGRYIVHAAATTVGTTTLRLSVGRTDVGFIAQCPGDHEIDVVWRPDADIPAPDPSDEPPPYAVVSRPEPDEPTLMVTLRLRDAEAFHRLLTALHEYNTAAPGRLDTETIEVALGAAWRRAFPHEVTT